VLVAQDERADLLARQLVELQQPPARACSLQSHASTFLRFLRKAAPEQVHSCWLPSHTSHAPAPAGLCTAMIGCSRSQIAGSRLTADGTAAQRQQYACKYVTWGQFHKAWHRERATKEIGGTEEGQGGGGRAWPSRRLTAMGRPSRVPSNTSVPLLP
jgi:hypothetical protein